MDRLLQALQIGSLKGDQVSAPSYADAMVRLDVPLAEGWTAGPIALVTEDRHHTGGQSAPPTVVREMLGGLHANHVGARWMSDLRLSSDLFTVRNDERILGERRIDVDQKHTVVSVGTIGNLRAVRLTTRLSVEQRTHRLAWRNARFRKELGAGLPDSANELQKHAIVFGAVEASRHLSKALIVSTGTRVYESNGKTFPAPTLRAEWSKRAVNITASLDRRYQFDGEYRPRVEETVAQPVFLFADPRWSDGGALSINRTGGWLDRFLSIELTGYARKVNRRPIGMDNRQRVADRPIFSRVSGRTVGSTATVSFATSGGASLQAAYTLQRVYTTDSATNRVADWDVPHSFAGFVGLPLGERWALTGAFQRHSGLPATPVLSQLYVPMLREPVELRQRLMFGTSNSARLPAYQRLDLGIRRVWPMGRPEWTLSVQVINALAAKNAFGYDWQVYVDALAAGVTPPPNRPGLPLVPSIGVTVRW